MAEQFSLYTYTTVTTLSVVLYLLPNIFLMLCLKIETVSQLDSLAYNLCPRNDSISLYQTLPYFVFV